MKKILLVTLPFFIGYNLFSQTFMDLNNEFLRLFEEKNYAAAVLVGEKAVVKAKQEYGNRHANYAVALYNLAEGYFALENWPKSLLNYKKAIPVYKIVNKTDNVNEIALINNSIASIYFLQKQFDSSAVFFKRAADYFYTNEPDKYVEDLTIISKLLKDSYMELQDYAKVAATCEKILPLIAGENGKANAYYYEMKYSYGYALYNLNRFQESEKALTEALPIAIQLYGKSHLEPAGVLFMLYQAVKMQNNFTAAERYILEYIEVLGSLEEKDNNTLASGFKIAGDLYSDNGHFTKAMEFYNKALSCFTSKEERNTDLYIATLQGVAYNYIQNGKLLEAKQLLQQLININTKKNGKENLLNGELLIVLSNAEVQLNELSSAELHANEGFAITTKANKKGSYLLGMSKEVLGMIYNKMGDTKKSIAAFKEALVHITKHLGEDSRLAASVYSNMGITYFEAGNYALSERAYEKSLDVRKKILGDKHPEYALSLINLGMIHVYQARYTEADKLFIQAMQIYTERDMLGSTNFIYLVNNIALMAELQGQYEDAKLLYLRLLEIMNERTEKNTIALYTVYNNISKLYFEENKNDSAAYFSIKALNLLRLEGKTATKEFIKTSNNLLLAYKNLKDYSKANSIAAELVPLTRKVMGEDAEVLGLIYSNLAILEQMQQNSKKSAEYLNLSGNITLKNFRDNFYVLSEKEKLGWWENRSFIFNLFPSLLVHQKITTGNDVEAMVDQQLQLKGFVLSDAAASLRKARSNSNPELRKLLDEWKFIKTLLGKLYALPVEERTLSTDSLELVTNTLEKKIGQSTGEFNTEKIINWRQVQSSLADKEAAVEFMQFPYYREGEYADTMLYAAIIISKELKSPQFVVLSNESVLSNILKTNSDSKEANINRLYRSTVKKPNATNANFKGDSLYTAIWEPLMPYLKNITTVSFAPDGLLHKVAFHAIPVSSDKILIDSLQLQQYSGIRQIAERNHTANVKWSSAYLVGNVEFNKSISHSGSTISYTGSSHGWNNLPGTAVEVKKLQQMFTSKGITTTLHTNVKATEESFKSLSNKSPQIIHLATHGFFLPQDEFGINSLDAMAGEQTLSASQNPLLRSGIILAGANKVWSGEKIPEDAEDGIVNAFEISQLDLSNTKLVVLSACETALGDVQGSEGVFGLQRAFKIAGVKNMIVSLWQVPDKETAELMDLFYRNVLKGNNVRTAFYQAQKEMRSKYSPYLWAAFVLIE